VARKICGQETVEFTMREKHSGQLGVSDRCFKAISHKFAFNNQQVVKEKIQ